VYVGVCVAGGRRKQQEADGGGLIDGKEDVYMMARWRGALTGEDSVVELEISRRAGRLGAERPMAPRVASVLVQGSRMRPRVRRSTAAGRWA